mmetsp:Transcript_12971/g.39207  ORF Transcript_12971/g.39207 Transcript_12971/m.39207 type:complete len:233 (+) Transcript_12971:3192-3890(+)
MLELHHDVSAKRHNGGELGSRPIDRNQLWFHFILTGIHQDLVVWIGNIVDIETGCTTMISTQSKGRDSVQSDRSEKQRLGGRDAFLTDDLLTVLDVSVLRGSGHTPVVVGSPSTEEGHSIQSVVEQFHKQKVARNQCASTSVSSQTVSDDNVLRVLTEPSMHVMQNAEHERKWGWRMVRKGTPGCHLVIEFGSIVGSLTEIVDAKVTIVVLLEHLSDVIDVISPRGLHTFGW